MMPARIPGWWTTDSSVACHSNAASASWFQYVL